MSCPPIWNVLIIKYAEDNAMNQYYPVDPDEIDLECMSVPELRILLKQLHDLYDERALQEPEDQSSEEYDEWTESLEDLDDLIDDIHDRLDSL